MKTLAAILSTFVLFGCNFAASEKSVSTNIPEYLQVLSWAESANASKDAEAAITENDYRLFIIAGRGQHMPGVATSLRDGLKKQCGTQFLPGSTDVIRDDKHQRLLQKAYDYAEAYNKIILSKCS